MAGYIGNFDSLNLLIENGANLFHKNNQNLNVFEEIIWTDNGDLFACIYPLYKSSKKNKWDLNDDWSYSLLHFAAS